ncbi:MAG: hypothetical protein LW884_07660 [Bacteroidetes bacterium]|jgi:uncharacterized membrane protein YuzA (DUF378 family)|nr:hypothetical protein [Bacteroidota bacterium]
MINMFLIGLFVGFVFALIFGRIPFLRRAYPEYIVLGLLVAFASIGFVSNSEANAHLREFFLAAPVAYLTAKIMMRYKLY